MSGIALLLHQQITSKSSSFLMESLLTPFKGEFFLHRGYRTYLLFGPFSSCICHNIYIFHEILTNKFNIFDQ